MQYKLTVSSASSAWSLFDLKGAMGRRAKEVVEIQAQGKLAISNVYACLLTRWCKRLAGRCTIELLSLRYTRLAHLRA